MRVLLTGGSGFIGKRLIKKLSCIDDVEITSLGIEKISSRLINEIIVPGFDCNIESYLEGKEFDCIIYLAGAGVNPSDRNIESLINVNSFMLSNLMSKFGDKKLKAVIYAGSSSEYASQHCSGNISEDHPLETQKLYGVTKVTGGMLALAVGHQLKIPVAHLRIFNAYGPGEAPHRLLPSLIKNLKNNNSVDLSEGRQVRDFIYVDDICDAIISGLMHLLNGTMDSGTYNISTGIGTAVRDFAVKVSKIMGVSEKLLNFGAIPLRIDDHAFVVGNPEKFMKACGWRYINSIDQGIEATLNEYN